MCNTYFTRSSGRHLVCLEREPGTSNLERRNLAKHDKANPRAPAISLGAEIKLIQFQKLLHDRMVALLHLGVGPVKQYPTFVKKHDTIG